MNWSDNPFKKNSSGTEDARPFYIPLPLNWNRIARTPYNSYLKGFTKEARKGLGE